MANLLLVSGLALLDVFSIRASSGLLAWAARFGAERPYGAFMMGATSGLVAAPCGAPAFAAVLTFVAATGSAVLGFTYLLAFSLGMTAVLAAVGIFAGDARGPAAERRLAGLAQACRRRRAARNGGVLRVPGGAQFMKRLGAILLLLAALAGPVRAQDEGIAIGAKAPAVVVNDIDGKPVNLADYLGKQPVLLEFWATWCNVCEELLPKVRAAHDTYGERSRSSASTSPSTRRRSACAGGSPATTRHIARCTTTRA